MNFDAISIPKLATKPFSATIAFCLIRSACVYRSLTCQGVRKISRRVPRESKIMDRGSL